MMKGLIVSVAVNAILGWLWLESREDLAAAIVQCNADKLAAVVEAEQITREALQSASDARIAELEERHRQTENALLTARDTAEDAAAEVASSEVRIRELELEASIDDIPDSTECLNVFIPSRVLHSGDRGEAGAGGGADGEAGADPGILNPADPSFSTVTFGDGMKLWQQDRGIIHTLNGQLAAIEALQPR